MKLNIMKKTSALLLATMMLATSFVQPQEVKAAENGVVLGTTGMFGRELINSTGIAGVTNYAADGKSFNFKYVTNFALSTRRINVVYHFEVDPTLAPFVTGISVKGAGSSRGEYSVEPAAPGHFFFILANSLFRTFSAVDVTVHLNTDYRSLPSNKYAYSIRMLNPDLDYQYILKTRATGLVEKSPTVYATNDYAHGLQQSYLGYTQGEPVDEDKLVDIEDEVYARCYPYIRRNDLVLRVDTMLNNFIERIDVYGQNGKFVQSCNVTNSGLIKVPVSSLYRGLSLANFWPVNYKIILKDGITFGDINPGVYEVTAYAETGSSILKSSLSTMSIYTGIALPDDNKTGDIEDYANYKDITVIP